MAGRPGAPAARHDDFRRGRGRLLPAALSHGIGSQVQRPLAFVVVGGALLGPVLILLVLPVLIDLFSRCGVAQGVPDAVGRPAE